MSSGLNDTSAFSVNTRKVNDRRVLRFDSPRALMVEVERLVASERLGKLRMSGNWTLGQNLGHLGAWVNFGFDGTPLQPPWIIKLCLRLMKNRLLNKGLPAGARIPKVEGGTFATEKLSTEAGLVVFRSAWARLEAGAPSIPNPIFGLMTHEEWKKVHLRHAELHLSFLHPGS